LVLRKLFAVSAAAWCVAGAAQAQVDLFAPDTISGFLDFRAAAASGERAWNNDGFGKTRFNGARDGYAVTATLASADLVWRPRLSWNVYGVLDGTIQPGQHHMVEVSEGYLAYKSGPGAWRVTAKAGYYYPEISLEHEGATWRVADTITPSAMNSWVGEEVKVAGAEVSASRAFGEQSLGATLGAFGNDDTSGTLLTFRGWALHDLRSTLSGRFPLSRLSPYMSFRQDQWTESSLELDDRAGYYGRLEYRPTQSSALHVFYYDNGGNRTAVHKLQWAWDTKFTEAGARVMVTPDIKLTAQAMHGETYMGFVTPAGIWADVAFNSAYTSAVRQLTDTDKVTVRADWFEVQDRSLVAVDDNNERGWALTAGYSHKLNDKMTFLAEGLHVWSDRPSRSYAGIPRRIDGTTFQAALRIDL
jgi:hypothetical protein